MPPVQSARLSVYKEAKAKVMDIVRNPEEPEQMSFFGMESTESTGKSTEIHAVKRCASKPFFIVFMCNKSLLFSAAYGPTMVFL
jgi:hypothetical protein